MKRTLSYLAVVLLLAAESCGDKGEVIPRSDMVDIYADMFLVDEQISALPRDLRNMADTTAVYEAVFRRYGYSRADYLASQEHYLQDPTRYGRILKKSIAKLEEQKRDLQQQFTLVEKIRKSKEEMMRFAPDTLYTIPGVDSVCCRTDEFLKLMQGDAEI